MRHYAKKLVNTTTYPIGKFQSNHNKLCPVRCHHSYYNQVNSESINIRHAELKKSHNQDKRKTHQKSLENNTRSNQSQNLIRTHQITIKFLTKWQQSKQFKFIRTRKTIMFENTVWQTLLIYDETQKEKKVSLEMKCIE